MIGDKDLISIQQARILAENAADAQTRLSAMNAGPIPVEISARHVHLSVEDALSLYGEALRPERPLSQPGQFLCVERVRLIGPKGVMIVGDNKGTADEFSKIKSKFGHITAYMTLTLPIW